MFLHLTLKDKSSSKDILQRRMRVRAIKITSIRVWPLSISAIEHYTKNTQKPCQLLLNSNSFYLRRTVRCKRWKQPRFVFSMHTFFNSRAVHPWVNIIARSIINRAQRQEKQNQN